MNSVANGDELASEPEWTWMINRNYLVYTTHTHTHTKRDFENVSQALGLVGQHQCSNICVIRVPDREEKECSTKIYLNK